MLVHRHAGALFAAHRDFPRENQFADVLEPDRRLVAGDVQLLRDRIDEMRRRHRPRQPARDIAKALQIERDERQDEIRRDEPVAVVDEPGLQSSLSKPPEVSAVEVELIYWP